MRKSKYVFQCQIGVVSKEIIGVGINERKK